MATKAKPTTAEELLAMPDGGFRYELVRGELVRMAPAGRVHGRRGEPAQPRNRTVQAHTPDGVTELAEADTLDGGDVVPGWRLPVAHIFA